MLNMMLFCKNINEKINQNNKNWIKKEYSLKLLKLVNEMEKLLFDELKSYQQTLLNFYI